MRTEQYVNRRIDAAVARAKDVPITTVLCTLPVGDTEVQAVQAQTKPEPMQDPALDMQREGLIFLAFKNDPNVM